MVEKRAPDTHTAFAARRIGKETQHIKWVEIGTGRTDSDGMVHVFLDRLPIGGFTGYVRLSPSGAEPSIEPLPEPPALLDSQFAVDIQHELLAKAQELL